VDAQAAWRGGFEAATAEVLAPRFPELAATAGLFERVFQPLVHAEYVARGPGEWDVEFGRRGFRALLRAHAEPDDALADRAFERYEAAWPQRVALFDDALAALQAARAHGATALISNGGAQEQRRKVEALGLHEWFDVVVISGEAGVRKPDGAIFARALDALGVAPAEALHVGDMLDADVRGARAAGLVAVWLNRAGAARDLDGGGGATDGAGPHFEVRSLGELVGVVESLQR
jgi:putative hydrolase of the HAD superfamily